MPRNPAGTAYSSPNAFSPLNQDGSRRVISSDEMNENFEDVGDELVNSLPRDGRAPMEGALKLANGILAAPSLTFATDADTGLFLSAPGVISLVVGGVQIGTISAAGVTSVADHDAFFFAATM